MTLEKLLGLSADEWDKLSDAELTEWAKKYFTVTRPDPEKIKARKEEEKKKPTPSRGTRFNMSDVSKSLSQIENLRKQLGI